LDIKWLMLTLVLLLTTCHPNAEVRTTEAIQRTAPEFGTTAPDCGEFYNNGHHREWAKCMGVPYR